MWHNLFTIFIYVKKRRKSVHFKNKIQKFNHVIPSLINKIRCSSSIFTTTRSSSRSQMRVNFWDKNYRYIDPRVVMCFNNRIFLLYFICLRFFVCLCIFLQAIATDVYNSSGNLYESIINVPLLLLKIRELKLTKRHKLVYICTHNVEKSAIFFSVGSAFCFVLLFLLISREIYKRKFSLFRSVIFHFLKFFYFMLCLLGNIFNFHLKRSILLSWVNWMAFIRACFFEGRKKTNQGEIFRWHTHNFVIDSSLRNFSFYLNTLENAFEWNIVSKVFEKFNYNWNKNSRKKTLNNNSRGPVTIMKPN